MAASPVVEWLFMPGLLGVGLPLILGIGVRIAASTGILMLLLMCTAALLPEYNPVLDDHLTYSVALVGLTIANPGYRFGLGRWWGIPRLARRYAVLE